ncbi:magnesium chelatase domain-containing protein, partial [Cryobacterium fucosi]
MALARTHAVALLGLTGALVEVEADISGQLPGIVLIGLPDAALSEATERVRAAAKNSGCPLTRNKLTINLSPAALPKHGSGFDLAIALACLAADDAVSAESVESVVHIGELALDGRLRPTSGMLPAVIAAARLGHTTVMVPAGNAAEAALVPGVRVIGVASLRDAAIWHGSRLEPIQVDAIQAPGDGSVDTVEPELADVIGNDDAILALQIAAAGGHHLFMVGPPGAGKTMLAARLPGLLPDLDPEASLEVSSMRSLSGRGVGRALATRPPLEAPHHTATAAAMVGGGSGRIRP